MNIRFGLQAYELLFERFKIIIKSPQGSCLGGMCLNVLGLLFKISHVRLIFLDYVSQECDGSFRFRYSKLPVLWVFNLFEVWKASHLANLKHQRQADIVIFVLVFRKTIHKLVGNCTLSVAKV